MADREGPIHKAIVQYLRLALPDALVATVKNEINKRGTAIAIEIAKAKARGVVTGFPDIIVLPWSHVGPMLFEVKAPGGYPSDAQKHVHEKLTSLGYRVAVVRSIDDVQRKLSEWGVAVQIPFRGVVR